ncbi:gamma-glutamylcyclotransferase family protein [Evansella tamaricis]|uniref:Gamma-glutamylcyclotransferase family protein n=1 Tax=Evansella tamaricis TaxID=2069301 RepID=A0ABS6JID0_9BACI|nr:gamma-glutamylcyclotransferase family protein [Evansella tamaricis]MBU9713431.1 gamma-glutamylcyclotransferase [Evansella tamaricis]
MKVLHHVFVYGTLRKGEVNHHFLTSANLLSDEAWTTGTLYDTGLGYPALLEKGTDHIYGEIYEVDDEVLASLDVLEGYEVDGSENLYERKKILLNNDNEHTEAFTYYISPQNENMLLTKIESGDWKQHNK